MRRREFIAGLGSAVAYPLTTLAQQRVRRIGVLMGYGEDDPEAKLWLSWFTQSLAELGWTDGRNLRTDVRWGTGNLDRARIYAKELVDLQPDVILAHTTPMTAALQGETRTIPIVFVNVADPIGSGFVESLPRPGGNITGFISWEASMAAKWLELLTEIAPGVKRVAIMFNPDTATYAIPYFLPPIVPTATSIGFLANPSGPQTQAELREVETAARILGVRLTILNATTPSEIEAAFAILVGQRIAALFVGVDTLFVEQRDQIAGLMARYSMPAVYSFRDYVDAGGLMSYGPSWHDAWRVAGNYVGRILNGDKPGDLPVQQSTRIETVLNLKTAKTLGLTISETLLATADEVIQ
jgi:putative ABC transport system substrate-binding protein